MNTLDFKIDEEKCIRCGLCVADCPAGVLADANPPVIVPEHEERCIRCQHCMAVCPTGALSIFRLKPENSLPLDMATWPRFEQMRAVMRCRRSIRQYKQAEVPRAVQAKVFGELAYAPTGANRGGLTLRVVQGRPAVERLLKQILDAVLQVDEKASPAAERMVKLARICRQTGKDRIFRGAPHLLVVSGNERTVCKEEDPVILLSYFDLLAPTCGLGTTWCGFLRMFALVAPEVHGFLDVPRGHYFFGMMFGYPDVAYARSVQRADAIHVETLDV